MSKSTNQKVSQAAPVLMIAAMILALSSGAGVAQTAAKAQGAYRQVYEELAQDYAASQVAWSTGAEGTQVPQDIRIMQRIVSTALGEVEAPELPDALKQDAESSGASTAYTYSVGGSAATVWTSVGAGNRVYSIGGRDVTGFYMQGYGYLFTVEWRVAPGGTPFLASGAAVERMAVERIAELNALAGEARRAAAAGETSEARAAGEAERTLEQERERFEERQAAWDMWSAQYRDVLAEALRDVVALYGSTLKRATPDESITFIADFGGGEDATVTATVSRGQLTGASRDESLAAVQLSRGETGVSGTLRTELKIMAEIIDSALQVEGTDDVWISYSNQLRHYGGDSSYQYVPGYGVLFHKAARLNLATQVVQQVAPSRVTPGVAAQSLRQRIDASTEEGHQAYTEHLADLAQKTAEILATYGPTLTQMSDDAWVGVYYDVGPAAGLLEGGITNFLVQARMEDIRQAGYEADGAAWLLDRLVTNEKQD